MRIKKLVYKILKPGKLLLIAIFLLSGLFFLLSGMNATAETFNNHDPISFYPRGGSNADWIVLSKYQCPGHCLETPKATLRVFFAKGSLNNQPNQIPVGISVLCRREVNAHSIIRYGNRIKDPGNLSNCNSGGHGYNDTYTVAINLIKNDFKPVKYNQDYLFADITLQVDSIPASSAQPMVGIWVALINGGGYVVPAEEDNNTQNYSNGNCMTGNGGPNWTGSNYAGCSKDGSGPPFTDQPMALWANKSDFGPDHTDNFTVGFKANCDIKTNQKISLRWYDADAYDSPLTQVSGLWFELLDINTGGHATASNGRLLNHYGDVGELGGNDSYRDIYVNINPDHEYRWVWHNVSATNGIQTWSPFSEVNVKIKCPEPENPPPPPPTPPKPETACDYFRTSNNASAPDFYHYSGNSIYRYVVYTKDGKDYRSDWGGRNHRTVYGGSKSSLPKSTDWPTANGSLITYTQFFPTSDYTKNYFANAAPNGPDVVVYKLQWHWNQSNNTWTYSEGNTENVTKHTERNCYSARCDISVEGNVPDGPGNAILASSTVRLNATLRNTGRQPLPQNLGGPLTITSDAGVFRLDAVGNPYPIASGDSRGTISFNSPRAPNSPQIFGINIYPDYNGRFPLSGTRPDGTTYGNGCLQNLPVYEKFDVTPFARSTLKPTEENPASDEYQTKTTNTASVAVPMTVISCAYKKPASCAPGPYPYNLRGDVPSGGFDTLNGNYQIPQPVNAGDSYCAYISVEHGSGYVGPNGYSPVYTEGLRESKSCPFIQNKPYFQVYGGNVNAAGSYAGGSCEGGVLASWYNRNKGSKTHYGADIQLSAIATAAITGIGSGASTAAGNDEGATGWPGATLSFANTANVSDHAHSPSMGGNYGNSHCITAVTNDKADEITTDSGTIGNGQLVEGAHKHKGNFKLTGGIIGKGKNLSLMVDGNVYIKDNINYEGWSTEKEVPSLVIKATGNIYIDPGVTQLDGLYEAYPRDSGGGKIYTCGEEDFTPVEAKNMYDTCNKQLTIYGSFVANQINLMRSFGSLRDGNTGQCSNKGFRNEAGAPLSCGAEVFRFSPEMFLSRPAIDPPNKGALEFDAYTSLPPVL